MTRQGTSVWVHVPCTSITKQSLERHIQSGAHKSAVELEAAARSTGGIEAALQQRVSLQRMAFLAGLRCMYWLAKQEVPHTTNYSSLLDLARDVGCTYLTNLRQVLCPSLTH